MYTKNVYMYTYILYTCTCRRTCVFMYPKIDICRKPTGLKATTMFISSPATGSPAAPGRTERWELCGVDSGRSWADRGRRTRDRPVRYRQTSGGRIGRTNKISSEPSVAEIDMKAEKFENKCAPYFQPYAAQSMQKGAYSKQLCQTTRFDMMLQQSPVTTAPTRK